MGTVKLSHYEELLQHDLNPATGMRAVPKLTLKHVQPNNFQKMCVSLAAQVTSLNINFVTHDLCQIKPLVDFMNDCIVRNPVWVFSFLFFITIPLLSPVDSPRVLFFTNVAYIYYESSFAIPAIQLNACFFCVAVVQQICCRWHGFLCATRS
jgi:hypothetical protein